MSQGGKSAAYQALKAHGVSFEKHYRDYTEDELVEMAGFHQIPVDLPPDPDAVPARTDDLEEIKGQLAGLTSLVGQLAGIVSTVAQPQQPVVAAVAPTPGGAYVKQPQLDPKQHAGVMLNLVEEGQVIRTDEYGNEWYQEEVNKPGYAKPRARRIYREAGASVHNETITLPGGYTETFEVPGSPDHSAPTEARVTLPSYQTGIFKPRGMPFKVHIYNGARGFDYDDVNAYYNGVDLVPEKVKRVYVSSDLCYDMQSVIRAIENEYTTRVLHQEVAP